MSSFGSAFAWALSIALLAGSAIPAAPRTGGPDSPDSERMALLHARAESLRVAERAAAGGTSPSAPDIGAMRRRADDALRMTAAYESLTGEAITPEMLQAELDRMARETLRPDLLARLFGVLDGDPGLAAEVLARPALARRLLEGAYSGDSSRTCAARAAAERFKGFLDRGERCPDPPPPARRLLLRRQDGPAAGPRMSGSEPVAASRWDRVTSRWPAPGAPAILEETPSGLTLRRTLSRSADTVEGEVYTFRGASFDAWWDEVRTAFSPSAPEPRAYRLPDLSGPSAASTGCGEFRGIPGAPSPRFGHSSGWIGGKMVFWGGDGPWGAPDMGGIYDPTTATWEPLPGTPAVLLDHFSHAVFTPTEMLVFMDLTPGYEEPMRGFAWDPVTARWRTLSQGGACPTAIFGFSAICTGSEVIFYGKDSPYGWGARHAGAIYDIVRDAWRPMSADPDCAEGRSGHRAVWTGSEMIVWGGDLTWDCAARGVIYDPATDTWRPMASPADVQVTTGGFTAVWSGREMLLFGGDVYSPTTGGARYDPAEDRWAAMSRVGEPRSRTGHTALWNGHEMMVWGGRDDAQNNIDYADGACYDPSRDAWRPLLGGPYCPTPRSQHTAVWTGAEMAVWGGLNNETDYFLRRNDGAFFDPSSNRWRPMGIGGFDPEAMSGAAMVHTGAEIILWGGESQWYEMRDTGVKLDLATATWLPTAVDASTPSARRYPLAVWTGRKMLIWGGQEGLPYPYEPAATDTGGLYDPASDSWRAMPVVALTPEARFLATAVWDGTEAILWGGQRQDSTTLADGGRFRPDTLSWTKVAEAGSAGARSDHAAAWTGSDMIVWGGWNGLHLGDGARYVPSTDTWSPVPETTPYDAHAAAWTGRELIVWGEVDRYPPAPHAQGERYLADRNVWRLMSVDDPCPPQVTGASAAWTGSRYFVCGRTQDGAVEAGLYAPRTDGWTRVPVPQDTFASGVTMAAWTGEEIFLYQGGPVVALAFRPCIAMDVQWARRQDLGPFEVEVRAIPGGGFPPFENEWDFGDGSSRQKGDSFTHAYPGPGTFPLVLRSTDGHGYTEEVSLPLSLAPPPTIAGVRRLTDPFRLRLDGSGFTAESRVTVGGVPAPWSKFRRETRLDIGKGTALKGLLPRGTPVTVAVTNPDGSGAEILYTRP